MVLENIQSVSEWYAGRSVFITGASGMVGRILVEKLLYSCPDISTIYVLIRNKKGKTTKERTEELVSIRPLFDRIREKDVRLFDKVVGINGDVAVAGLGISAEDKRTLQEHVSVVFHAAASVRFDLPVRDVLLLNARGTRDVLELAKDMKHIEAFIHVSTGYSNSEYNNIEERVYPAKVDWKKMIKMVETAPEGQLAMFTDKIIGVSPNTYTYTKSLAENIVDDYRDKVPAVICRPTIVLAAIKEPRPGYIDKLNSPAVLLIGVGKGVLRLFQGKADMHCVPVDTTVNILITSAWYKAVYMRSKDQCKPNQLVVNASTLKGGVDLIDKYGYECLSECPNSQAIWYPFAIVVSSWILFQFLNIFLHLLPGVVVDSILTILRRKEPRLLPIYRRMFITMDSTRFFSTNHWVFNDKNLQTLKTSLLPEDKNKFEIVNQSDLDYKEYSADVYTFARMHLFGEPLQPPPSVYRQMKIFYCLHLVTKYGLILLLLYYCFTCEWILRRIRT